MASPIVPDPQEKQPATEYAVPLSRKEGAARVALALQDGTGLRSTRYGGMGKNASILLDEPREQPEAVPFKRLAAIVNTKAGSVGPDAAKRLRAVIAEQGGELVDLIEDVRCVGGARLHRLQADALIVLGGDGTARSACEACAPGCPPLILLPGGTLNVLPRALLGELAWPDALAAALQKGRVRHLTGARANGRAFFVAGMFGGPTLIAQAREAAREGRWITFARRLHHFSQRALARSVLMAPDGRQMSRAKGVGVLCPAYSGEVADSALEWVRLEANSMVDLVRVGAKSAFGAWRNDPAVHLQRANSGIIVSPGLIPAVLDGEPINFFSKVKIEFVGKGPRVLALD